MSWSIIEAWASLFIAIMLFSVLRHPTCASCVACMCCRMSDSIKHVWACPDLSLRCGHRSLFQSCCCWCYVIQPVHHIDFLLQSCCCWCYVIQPVHHVLHECVVGCPILSSTMSMSRSTIAAWASLFNTIMLFLVLRHPTCASCVAWIYCRMSNSIKHV